MIIRVTNVEWTWLGLEWPPSYLVNLTLMLVYNMNEIGLNFRAHPNKTLSQRKVKGRKLQKERVTLALAINSTGTHKLKLLINYTSKLARCFGRWQPHEYVRWYSNKTT